MTKILIVDDEKLIRAGILKILSDAYGSDASLLEAKNGLEALEICKSQFPNVMITDIRMPGMNGVELMEAVSALERKPVMIVLSGYDDFSYAKAAIESGASSYILKPVDSQELLKAVDKALAGIRRTIHHKNEEQFRSLINEGHLSEDVAMDIADFARKGIYCVSICTSMCNCMVSAFLDGITHYVIEQKQGYVSFIVSKDQLEKVVSHPSLENCAIGLSLEATTVSDLRIMRHQSFCALLQKFFAPEQKGLFRYSEERGHPDFTDLDALYDKITANLDLLNEDEVRKAVRKFLNFESIETKYPDEFLYYAYRKITTGLFARYPKFTTGESYLYLKSIMIENIVSASTLAEWKTYVLDYILFLLQLLKNQQGKYSYITTAIQYIKEHYNQDITMATVANYVSMNYTWFSEKFKEQMGVNFNDYLKRFRMEQAKYLLEKGTFKVYEVAEKCGFKDVKHFMKSFREMNGMSAGEYGRLYSR